MSIRCGTDGWRAVSSDELHQAFVPGREATLLDVHTHRGLRRTLRVGIDAGVALAMACWLARVRADRR